MEFAVRSWIMPRVMSGFDIAALNGRNFFIKASELKKRLKYEMYWLAAVTTIDGGAC